MYNLGKLLKELREEKNVSMDKMVEDLKKLYDVNIAKSTISKWENNKADPSMEYARILIKYFNVSLDYLLGISKYKNKDEELKDYKSKMNEFAKKHNKNFYENKLLNSFNKLNDEGKNEAIKRVDELTELNKYKKEEDNKIIEVPKKEKQIWEKPGKEYLMPKASHDKDGEFTEEEYKHDDDLMNNDDLWK
ncbi:MAG: helix-turn-helix transcriptional regulator [Clostridium sp.]|uniref:helix-turn-helix domain-containing protein n=1 Tax=Clostridium sp. TaxID=1506 RepID=UPI0028FF8C32|nr:helix-turn-helix transcriptional regulator [Clostridium sp.]MDU2683140.1 helix-turn-helix transcriptional regulator [Clostridium sp.]